MRARTLARPDPLIVLVGGLVIVAGSLGLFARLELDADHVAQLEAGLIMVVSAIRMWANRSRESADTTATPTIVDDAAKPT